MHIGFDSSGDLFGDRLRFLRFHYLYSLLCGFLAQRQGRFLIHFWRYCCNPLSLFSNSATSAQFWMIIYFLLHQLSSGSSRMSFIIVFLDSQFCQFLIFHFLFFKNLLYRVSCNCCKLAICRYKIGLKLNI